MTAHTEHRLRIVVPRYGRDIIGGTESLMRGLAHSLRDAGWDVEVFTTCAADERTWANAMPPGRTTEDGIVVQRFPVLIPRLPRTFRQASRVFWRIPARLRPERAWIIAQGPCAPRLIGALRTAPAVPTIFMPYLFHPTLRGLPVTPGVRMLVPAAHDERPMSLRTLDRTLAATDALLYSTEEERTILETAHPIARNLPHAVGTVAVTPPATVDGRRFRDRHSVHGPYFIYGGRSTPGKGVEQLLAGMAMLRSAGRGDVELVLTGEAGEGRAPGDGVRALGRLDDDDRWDAIAGAAAAIVPSFHESLSLLALEAWAAGRPVLLNAASPVLAGQVARSGGGIAYLGEAGLASAARHILDDAPAAAALGAAGRTYVEANYRWPAVHERLIELIALGPRDRT